MQVLWRADTILPLCVWPGVFMINMDTVLDKWCAVLDSLDALCLMYDVEAEILSARIGMARDGDCEGEV